MDIAGRATSVGRARAAPAVLLVALIAALGTAGEAGAAAAPSRAQARDFAAAVNLTAADVPGFTISTDSSSTRGDPTSSAECYPRLGHRVLRKRSPDFELASESRLELRLVSSRVSVWPSARSARRWLAAARSLRVRRCLARVFDRHFRGNGRGVSYGPLSIAVRPQSAPGANDSLALRLATRLTTGRLSARFTVDVLAFRLGPALVTLVAAGLGAPFPAADEQRLFSLLLARAIPRPL